MVHHTSFATKYGVVTAVVFLIQTTFSAAKYCEPGEGDDVATPFAALSNLLLFVLYAGFFVIGGRIEVLKAALFYFGGLGTYTLGYLAFSLASFTTWTDGDTDAVKGLNIAGSCGFTLGSIILLYLATPPWGGNGYVPNYKKPCSNMFFGPPAAWWGCACFLSGSLLFLAGTSIDTMSSNFDTMVLYQVGILIFVPGRAFFLASGIAAIQNGMEFRYGSSISYTDNVAASLAMGARLFAIIRQIREGAVAQAPRAANTTAPPGGSWWRKAVKDADGRYGRVELKDGQPWLFTKLTCDDGSCVDASAPFNDLDTFSAVNGQLLTGCVSGTGRLTTRDIVSMCDLYDEMDYSGHGFLTPSDLWNFVKSTGLREVQEAEIVKLVKDMDLDSGASELTQKLVGLDFPEFITLVASSLGTGYTCQIEMMRFWTELTKDSVSGRLEVTGLSRWLKEAHLEVDEGTLQSFLKEYGGRDDNTMEQQGLYGIFLNSAEPGASYTTKKIEASTTVTLEVDDGAADKGSGPAIIQPSRILL